MIAACLNMGEFLRHFAQNGMKVMTIFKGELSSTKSSQTILFFHHILYEFAVSADFLVSCQRQMKV